MTFLTALACTLSMTLPRAVILTAPGGCVGDSIRPACLVSVRLYGEAQRTNWATWGAGPPTDTLLATWDAAGREGQPMLLVATLPARIWVLDVRAVDANGREGCPGNRVLRGAAHFILPPWRARP